jgi:hypothetical protein
MNKLVAFWNAIKSNPVFVAVSSAAVGAIVSGVQDEMASGKLDWSRGGINKLTGYAVTAAIAALVHLYRPQPNPTVPATIPPSTAVVEVPAKLEPIDSAAVPVPPTKGAL